MRPPFAVVVLNHASSVKTLGLVSADDCTIVCVLPPGRRAEPPPLHIGPPGSPRTTPEDAVAPGSFVTRSRTFGPEASSSRQYSEGCESQTAAPYASAGRVGMFR